MPNLNPSEKSSLGGLSQSAVVLLIGVGMEAACVAVGVWITSWYRLNTALFNASMAGLSLDIMCYLGLLCAVPAVLYYLDKESSFRNIAIFLFTWIGFIFVFVAFSSIPLI
jgi:hypothetical protein